MKLKLFISILFISFFIFLYSCYSYRFIDIQVLSPCQNDTLIKSSGLFVFNSNVSERLISTNLDTSGVELFITHFSRSLENNLKKSPLFNKATFINTHLPDTLNGIIQNGISCSFHSFIIKDSVNKVNISDYWYVIYKVVYNAEIRFFKIPERIYIKSIFLKDSSFWKSRLYSSKYEFNKENLNRDRVLMNISDNVAFKVTQNISPIYHTVERVIYFGQNRWMRKAFDSFSNNEINDAVDQWKHISEHATNKMASRASFNIALCYEMLDSLTLAKKWINKAVLLKSDTLSLQYQSIINKRYMDKTLLDNQFKKLEFLMNKIGLN